MMCSIWPAIQIKSFQNGGPGRHPVSPVENAPKGRWGSTLHENDSHQEAQSFTRSFENSLV